MKIRPQKGPFVRFDATLEELDTQGRVQRRQQQSDVNGGEAIFDVPPETVFRILIDGQFISETDGDVVSLEAPLEGVFVSSPINGPEQITRQVNLLTHFTSRFMANGPAPFYSPLQIQQAEQQILGALGFGPDVDPGQIDITQVPSSANLDDPTLRLLVLGSGTLLRKRPGRMPAEFYALGPVLGADGNGSNLAQQFGLFNGIEVEEVIRRVRESGQIVLPDQILDEPQVIACNLICQLIEAAQPRLSVVGAAAFESFAEVRVAVERSGDTALPVTVHFSTRPGTATPGVDYVAVERRVTIPAGESRVFVDVPVLLDHLVEGDEYFEAVISSEDVALGAAQARVTITDDPPPGLRRNDGLNVQIADLCFVSSGRARSLEQAMCPGTVPELTGLVGIEEELAFRLQVELNSFCADANACPQRQRDWAVDLALLTETNASVPVPANDTPVPLGTYAFAGARVRPQGAASFGSTQFLVSLDEPGIRQRLADAQRNGWRVRLIARVDQAAPDELATTVPRQQPLAPTVVFGDRELALIPGSVVLTPDAAECAAGETLLQARVLTVDPALFGTGNELDLQDPDVLDALGASAIGGLVTTGVTACVALPPAADPRTAIQAMVRSADVDLAGSYWGVPATHGWRTRIPALGDDALVLPGLFAFPDTGTREYVVEGWPFSVQVSGARLTPAGVEISVSGTRYLQRRDALAAGDPRRVRGFAANDAMFTEGAGSAVLQLTASGLAGRLRMSGGSAEQAYPRAILAWQAFDLDLANGDWVVDGEITATLGLQQSTGCPDAACAHGRRRYLGAGPLRMDTDGDRLGPLALSATGEPGFGLRDDSRLSFARPDDLAPGEGVVAALPGFRHPAAAPVAAMLMGHLQAAENADIVTIHPLGSASARRGNYAPAGLVVGPDIYADALGQPQIGSGRDLAGATQRVRSGPDDAALASSIATKYVLRPEGMTGVFNSQPDALAGPVAMGGFSLNFRRFAFRYVANRLDPETWLDGSFVIPGDAGIDNLAFENLQLDCAANLGDARLQAEECNGTDDNGNGVVDEGCPSVLATWRMETLVHDLRFAGSSGEPVAACGTAPQFAELGQSVRPLGLDRVVAMRNAWTPDGRLRAQEVRGIDTAIIEPQAEDRGFGVQLAGLRLDCVDGDAATPQLDCAVITDADDTFAYGWMRGTATVGLPFWESVSADIRLANTLDGPLGQQQPAAEPTVLLPQGRLALETAGQLNMSLMQAVIDSAEEAEQTLLADLLNGTSSEPSRIFNVRYEWGHTGFGFRLPAYFTPAAFTDANLAQFTGVRRGADLIVFEVGAGINYIEPQRTRFSFGASADIARAQNLKFSVELDDLRSLQKVDALLVRSGLIASPLLEPVFNRIDAAYARFNELSGRGLDRAIETGLTTGLEQVGQAAARVSPLREDPLVTLSRATAVIATLPEQLSSALRATVRDPLAGELDETANAVRAAVTSWRQALIAQANTAPNAPPSAEVVDGIRGLQAAIGNVDARVRDIEAQLDARVNSALTVIDDTRRAAAEVAQSTLQVEQMLMQVGAVFRSLCTTGVVGEASSYVTDVLGRLDAARALLSAAQGSALLVPLVELAVDDAEVAARLREGQAGIQDAAEQLLQRLNAVETGVRGAVCTDDVNAVVNDATAFVTDIRSQAMLVEAQLNRVDAFADDLRQVKATLVERALAPLGVIDEELAAIVALLETPAPTPASVIRDALDDLDQQLAALPQLARFDLDALIRPAEATTARDILDAVQDETLQPIESAINALESNTRDLLVGRFPMVAADPDALRVVLVGFLMDSGPVKDVRTEVDKRLGELQHRVNELVLEVTDQVNAVIRGALARVEAEVNDALVAATAPLKAIPLQSASLDGYAVVAGQELERAHVGAEWTLPGGDGDDPKTFGAALDAVSWSANNKEEGGCSIPPGESRLDVTLSAFNLPARFGTSELTMKKIWMGFTLDQAADGFAPKGVFGGLLAQGEIGFTEFIIYDPGLVAGIGDRETYLGARAGAVFSAISLEAAFLAGRTCNQEILLTLDPSVAQFIPIPDSGFAGAYVRGSASIPVYSNGCPLTIGVAADMGAWLLAGPPLTVGGLVGGGAFGKVGCVGALRGQLRALGTVNTDGDFVFAGEGFGVAGLGLCEPAGWTSIPRSRADGLCGTADARIAAQFDGSWSLLDLTPGAIY